MKNLIIFAALFLPAVSFAQVPDFPMAFWGGVTIDGADAPVDTVVRVYDGSDTQVGEVSVTEAGVYGYTEPTKQKLVIGEGEGTLIFSVQSASVFGGVETEGLTTITHPSFVSGETLELDLAFETVPVVAQEPRRSSGGGGGGSSRSRASETPAAAVLGAATTTEDLSDAELRIELQKQLILILTQLISLLQQKFAQ
jgi:hypothetical protein